MLHVGSWSRLFMLTLAGSSVSLIVLLNLYGKIAFESDTEASQVENAIDNFSNGSVDLNSAAGSVTMVTSELTPTIAAVVQLELTRSNCRKFVMVLAKRLMKVLHGCIQELKENHPEKGGYDEYFQCAIRCAMVKIFMVPKDLSMSREGFQKFIDVHVNRKFHNMVHNLTTRCIDKFAYIIKPDDMNDPRCLNHGNFVKCVQEDVADVNKFSSSYINAVEPPFSQYYKYYILSIQKIQDLFFFHDILPRDAENSEKTENYAKILFHRGNNPNNAPR